MFIAKSRFNDFIPIKKYCLFLNRTEYLITAGLWDASLSGKAPTDQQLRENEEIYDNIVSSFKLLNR